MYITCPYPAVPHVFKALSKVNNLFASGTMPSDEIPHLCSASLVAITKKNGGLYPIAFDELLQRVTSKCPFQVVHAFVSNNFPHIRLEVECLWVVKPLYTPLNTFEKTMTFFHSPN